MERRQLQPRKWRSVHARFQPRPYRHRTQCRTRHGARGGAMNNNDLFPLYIVLAGIGEGGVLRSTENILLIFISLPLGLAFVGSVRHWLESGRWSFLPLAV